MTLSTGHIDPANLTLMSKVYFKVVSRDLSIRIMKNYDLNILEHLIKSKHLSKSNHLLFKVLKDKSMNMQSLKTLIILHCEIMMFLL